MLFYGIIGTGFAFIITIFKGSILQVRLWMVRQSIFQVTLRKWIFAGKTVLINYNVFVGLCSGDFHYKILCVKLFSYDYLAGKPM